MSPNAPAQARRANGDRIEPKGSTGVALQRAGYAALVSSSMCPVPKVANRSNAKKQ